jgi:hypothetical protein
MKHIILLLVLITIPTIILAQTHHESFIFSHSYNSSYDSCDVDLEIKYSIEPLMGEPVVKAHARYTIGQNIQLDGKDYIKSEFPESVIAQLRIYDLVISVPFNSSETPETSAYGAG